MVDAVSETTHVSWDAVFSMDATEFLAIYSYIIDKRNYEKEQLKKWKQTT